MEYSDELDDAGEDDYDIDSWVHGYNHFRGYPRLADMSDSRELSGNHTRSNSSAYQTPLPYWAARDFIRQPPIKVQPKESVSLLLFTLVWQVKWLNLRCEGTVLSLNGWMFVLQLFQDTERRARLLQETKKSKEKAQKKRLKKQVNSAISSLIVVLISECWRINKASHSYQTETERKKTAWEGRKGKTEPC